MLLKKANTITTPTAYSNGFLHSVKPNIVLGDELVVNGGFDTDTNWTKGTGWSISDGIATLDGTQVGSSGLGSSVMSVTSGKTYKVVVNVISTSSGFRLYDNNGVIAYGLSVGENVFYRTVTSSNYQVTPLGLSGTTGSIDNISVKEKIDADFTFTRNSSATRVGEDGYIQDVQIIGGELVQNGDFEEIGSELITNGDFSDGTNNWVNPIYGADNSAELSVLDGALRIEKTADLDWRSSFARQYPISYTNGKIYRVKYSLKDGNTSGADVYIRSNFANSGKTINIKALTSDWVEYTDYYVADSITEDISFGVLDWQNTGTGQYYFVDNVSVKEVGQDWTFGTGWSINNGVVYFDNPTGTEFSQSLSTTAGKYRISFDLDITSGAIQTSFASPSTSTIETFTTSGRKSVDIVTTASFSKFRFVGLAGSVFNIDNISVKEVTDDTNLPRINYEGFTYENGLPVPYSGKGHLLLEGQRTNLVPYSEDFSSFALNFNTLTSNTAISPDGTQNASLIQSTTTGSSYIADQSASITIGNTYTFSVFAKKGNNDWIRLAHISSYATAAWFDLKNGVVGTVNSTSATIEDYGNGWYRCTNTFVATNNSGNLTFIGICDGDNSTNAGAIGQNDYIWGWQIEEASYASSYIPTLYGTAVTRLGETCNNATQSFPSEGVLYAEIAALANDLTDRRISISDGTFNNNIQIYYYVASNRVRTLINSGGIVSFDYNHILPDLTEYHKFAVRYKDNDFSFWIDGVQVGTDTSGNAPTGLSELHFANILGTSSNFYGKTKMVATFPYLSNDEMECLTGEGYGTFEALAAAYSYTIK